MYEALLNEIANEPIVPAHEILERAALEILRENPPVEKIEVRKQHIIDYYDKLNLLRPEILDKLTEQIIPGDDEFGNVSITTISLGGVFTGLKFNEEDLIKNIALLPTPAVPIIDCNFGSKVYEDYALPIKNKKSNRGRKKKEKKKKPRKLPGTGRCFNSQITFIANYCGCCENPEFKNRAVFRSTADFDNGAGVLTVPARFVDHLPGCIQHRLKYKIFRNGKIILSGAKPKNMNFIMQSINDIIFILTRALGKPTNAIKLETLCPTMKNYKYFIYLEPNQAINFENLERIFNEEKTRVLNPENVFDRARPSVPIIVDSQAHIENTNFSVKFRTPTAVDPLKMVRVNFFQRNKKSTIAKINILGAMEDNVTRQIINFIEYVFNNYRDEVIIEWT